MYSNCGILDAGYKVVTACYSSLVHLPSILGIAQPELLQHNVRTIILFMYIFN